METQQPSTKQEAEGAPKQKQIESKEQEIKTKLKACLVALTPLANDTLVDYVLHLYKTNKEKLAAELESLAPNAIEKVLESIQGESPAESIHLDQLKVGSEYNVQVTNIAKFGAFVKLLGVQPHTTGLIHISQLAQSHVDRVQDVLACGQVLTAFLTKIQGSRLSLSLLPPNRESRFNREPVKENRKRLTSPERFEIRQLINAGALDAKDYPDLDKVDEKVEAQENVEIEVVREVPPFLSGHIQQPVDINDEPTAFSDQPQLGELQKAARNAAKLARDRIELRAKDSQDTAEVWKKQLGALGKPQTKSLKVQRESLPIFSQRQDLLKLIDDNNVVVIIGDTGSGKTTQITQYLYESGYSSDGHKIGCTQPRRVAAASIAKRVAQEVGCKVAETVGYLIRFEDHTSNKTRIKYMTDGMLLREVLLDPNLSDYKVIMLDEAHERTLATDILFALLKKAQANRPDLKVIVTSATLDAEKFSAYFGGCPIFKIAGRTFPVEIHYSKFEQDYLEAALVTVMRIHMSEPNGDILVFLTGQEEIDTACEMLYKRNKALENISTRKLVILPVYSALPGEMQSRIFEETGENTRKVIFATNIAETSITIDGIYFVVDPGFVKVNMYDPKTGMNSLKITPISKAQANQRAGRAGRTGPGKCFRLYTQEAFEKEMPANSVPEIQRESMTHTVLLLKSMGINELTEFDFMDKPSSFSIFGSLAALYELGALDKNGAVTRVGRAMVQLPIEPAMARVLIESTERNCSEEMLTIMAMLSISSVFFRPQKRQLEADRCKARFNDPSGDHMTLLNVYNQWLDAKCSKTWCTNNFILDRCMAQARNTRLQLSRIILKQKLSIKSCNGDTETILRALCTGYFRNTARQSGDSYRTLGEDLQVSIHPASALFGKRVSHVLYNSIVFTSREYMHWVSAIRPGWLCEAVPHHFQPAQADSKRRRVESVKPLLRGRGDPDGWRISAQRRLVKYESTTFGGH